MTPSERAYRLLLRAYPARTRAASADDMVQLFTDRLRDAASARDVVAVWVEAFADVAATAPREHLVARRGRQLVEGPVLGPERVPMKRDVALASLPLVVSLLLVTGRPLATFWDAMYADPPGLFGLPLGMAILVMLAAVASAGMLAVRRNRELNDPWHQAFFLACMLVPAPTIALAAGLVVASLYVLGGTIVLMLARFRRLMAAMMIPFLAWLVVGPFVMRIIVSIIGGLAEAQ